MKKPRVSTLIIIGQLALLIFCLAFLGLTLWHNHFLKLKAKEFAAEAGFMQARQDFVRGRRMLYEIKLYRFDAGKDSGPVPTDGISEPTGKSDGPFQIHALLVNQEYPTVHQEIQKAFVDAYNQHMHQMYEKPEWFDANGFRVPDSSKSRKLTNSAMQQFSQ